MSSSAAKVLSTFTQGRDPYAQSSFSHIPVRDRCRRIGIAIHVRHDIVTEKYLPLDAKPLGLVLWLRKDNLQNSGVNYPGVLISQNIEERKNIPRFLRAEAHVLSQ